MPVPVGSLGAMAVDTADLERELCRIPEVYAARIITNGSGRPTEARILASPRRSPKRVRRDVQSVAMASFSVDFDNMMITVTQLDQATLPGSAGRFEPAVSIDRVEDADALADTLEEAVSRTGQAASQGVQGASQTGLPTAETGPPTAGTSPPLSDTAASTEARGSREDPHRPEMRDAGAAEVGTEQTGAPEQASRRAGGRTGDPEVRVGRVTFSVENDRCSVEITLRHGESSGRGTAQGAIARPAGGRLAARAALSALSELNSLWAGAELEDAVYTQLGETNVAVVSIILGHTVLAGAAVVEATGDHHAMAKAVTEAASSATSSAGSFRD